MRCSLALFVGCILSFAQAAAAQVNCGNVVAVPGPTGYQRRGVDRCEGFYQQQVGSALEFLSFVNGTINYDLESDRALIVSVPAPSSVVAAQIFLTARALRPGIYYRMDGVIGPAGKFRWPLDAVIAPAKLPADAIGIAAWVDRELGKHYIPVSVLPENVAASARGRPTVVLRSSVDIERLQWRSWSENRESGSPRADWLPLGGPASATIRAGQAIKLDLSTQSSGPAVVDIAPKYVNVDRVQTLQIRVIMP